MKHHKQNYISGYKIEGITKVEFEGFLSYTTRFSDEQKSVFKLVELDIKAHVEIIMLRQ